jgi:hypothetical protein
MYNKISLILCPIMGNLNNPALEESSPKTGSFALYQTKSFTNGTGRSQGHVNQNRLHTYKGNI